MRSVMQHSFSQVPSAEIQRSTFNRSHGYKTTFNAGRLIPVFWDEVVPGDTINLSTSMVARLATPIYPIMDNMFLDIHYFFVPYRIIWDNFRKFMGEQLSPGDSTDYTVPSVTAPAGGYNELSIQDYLGIPPKIENFEHSVLPIRAYYSIYNEWYRDQNIRDPFPFNTSDTPAAAEGASQVPYYRGKRHDYFTSCLPWLQKGDAIDLPLGDTAPVQNNGVVFKLNEHANGAGGNQSFVTAAGDNFWYKSGSSPADTSWFYKDGLEVDLSAATAATVNELRQAFQIQRLLERDARSGTRYSEVVKSHFGVDFFDVSYRPEFLGGDSTPINVTQVPQTSETNTTPMGTMAAFGTASMQSGGITKSFTEHGIVMGIVSARADLTYQQGLERAWSRSTRYDFYWPVLAHLGEQAVLTKELYLQSDSVDTGATGTPDNEKVFGYQERWAEMRYKPSKITGLFRSSAAASLDAWHLSQEFTALPELNDSFINENPPMDRVVAVPSEPDFILDCYFNYQHARPMPIYSVPGMVDHF